MTPNSKRLKTIRRRLAITQDAAAYIIRTHGLKCAGANTFAKWESGERNPPPIVLKLLSQMLAKH